MDETQILDKVEESINYLKSYYTRAAHEYSKNIRDDQPATRIHSAHLWGQVAAYDYLMRHVKCLRGGR